MQRALAFDQSPPLGVAFRFFLNVPAFLMLAALSLGGLALTGAPYTRWNPGVLGIVHLLTLGVVASAMLGAMMQILPVAAHIRVLRPNITSLLVHGCLSLGTLSLAGGFASGASAFHAVAIILLASAFGIFLIATVGGLLRDGRQRSPGSKEVLIAVRLALAALAVTITFGVLMAGIRAGFWRAEWAGAAGWLHGFPDLHALWGLAGWVGLLIAGISYQVIPIFQATEVYPRRLTDTLAPVVFLLLIAVTVAISRPPADSGVLLRWLPATLLCLAYLLYGSTTAWLLFTRKRPAPEPTTWFWHVAMVCLISAAILGGAYPWLTRNDIIPIGTLQMLVGTLLIPGVAVSAVNGMLYKIVPFLLWHNAQRRAPVALPFMPKVKQFISERDAMRQFVAHACAVVLLTAACVTPVLLLPAALTLAVSAGLLAKNIGQALKLYLDTCRRIEEAAR